MNEKLRKALVEDYEARAKSLEGDDLSDTEKQMRASVQAPLEALKEIEEIPEAPPAPAELTSQVQLRSYFGAIALGNRIEGAALELNQELGLNDNSEVPLAALMDTEPEKRAATSIRRLLVSWVAYFVVGQRSS